jgi:hypothetical protein
MHVSTFAVAEQGNLQIEWLARWGRPQSGELLLKQVRMIEWLSFDAGRAFYS